MNKKSLIQQMREEVRSIDEQVAVLTKRRAKLIETIQAYQQTTPRRKKKSGGNLGIVQKKVLDAIRGLNKNGKYATLQKICEAPELSDKTTSSISATTTSLIEKGLVVKERYDSKSCHYILTEYRNKD